MENIQLKKGAIDASDCISEDWNFLKSNYWLFLGMIVVELVIIMASGLIPYAGNIINIIVGGALACGVYIALLAQRRGDSVPFSLMFEGFSRLVPTTLITLIASIPWFIFGIAIVSFIDLPQLAPDGSNIVEMKEAILNSAFLIPLISSYSVALIISLVFSILLFFALPLIAERNVGIGDALKLSVSAALNNIGGLILLLVFEGLIAFAGFLACGIGIIFVLPIIYAANIAAYKRVFPDENSELNNEPPRPEDYGGTYGTPQQ